MQVKVHFKKEITAYFSTTFEAIDEVEAEQRVRDSIKGESWYSVELEIPRRNPLEEPKTITIV